ncbi:MAG: hypothetical protein ABIN01_14795 [Ferruginibacter sp.]
MDKEQFIKKFASQFEDVELPNVYETTDFKSLSTWDSLTAMSVQLMIEEEYQVTVTNESLKNTIRVIDLFELVKAKQALK